jgi:hypothetical protein
LALHCRRLLEPLVPVLWVVRLRALLEQWVLGPPER